MLHQSVQREELVHHSAIVSKTGDLVIKLHV